MANFDRSGMTQAGINLMGKAVGGATIQFTKLVLGDGIMTGEILDLQGVVSPKQNVDVTRIERNDNQCTVGGELLTSSVKQGFFWRECGLYAMDPDQGEILYNYAYSTKPDYIAQSDSGMMEEILVAMVATVGSNTNVNVSIDNSMVMTTKKEFNPIKQKINELCFSINDFYEFVTGDGDYTNAITHAISQIPNGGTLYFPQGIYRITDTIVVDKTITIRGSFAGETGASTTILKDGDFDGIILHRNVTLEHLMIKSKDKTIDTGCGIKIGDKENSIRGDNATLYNVWVTSVGGDGILLSNGNHSYLANVSSMYNMKNGIKIDTTSTEKSGHHIVAKNLYGNENSGIVLAGEGNYLSCCSQENKEYNILLDGAWGNDIVAYTEYAGLGEICTINNSDSNWIRGTFRPSDGKEQYIGFSGTDDKRQHYYMERTGTFATRFVLPHIRLTPMYKQPQSLKEGDMFYCSKDGVSGRKKLRTYDGVSINTISYGSFNFSFIKTGLVRDYQEYKNLNDGVTKHTTKTVPYDCELKSITIELSGSLTQGNVFVYPKINNTGISTYTLNTAVDNKIIIDINREVKKGDKISCAFKTDAALLPENEIDLSINIYFC